jgi:ElaB/YqjD/DUF883 family membrane-anchored ribosome-binding protein
MDQERRSIEREIQQTTQSLRDKIEKLEDHARQVVGTVTDGVKQTAETISKTADALSLNTQMQKRPGTVVAAAVGAGLLAGLRFARRQGAVAAVARPTIGRAVAAGVLSQAAGILLPVAAGVAATVVGEWAKKKYPGSSPYVNAVQTALGAKPVSEPLADNEPIAH